MRKALRFTAVLVGVAILSILVATPAMAAPKEKTTVVAPVVGGPENGTVKAGREGKLVPNKIDKPPYNSTTNYEGAVNADPGTFDPGTVFWDDWTIPQ